MYNHNQHTTWFVHGIFLLDGMHLEIVHIQRQVRQAIGGEVAQGTVGREEVLCRIAWLHAAEGLRDIVVPVGCDDLHGTLADHLVLARNDWAWWRYSMAHVRKTMDGIVGDAALTNT